MFYTYFHTRNDTQKPFYVGKGSGNRAYDSDRSAHWRSIVAKHGHTVHIAAQWPTEAEAFEHEKFLILCFKDMNVVLCNKTNGGEGTVGWIPTAENRETTSKVTKARWADPVYKVRVSESIRIGVAKEGVLEARNNSIKVALAKPEAKSKLSSAQTRLWESPEHRSKMKTARASSEAVAAANPVRLAKSTAAQRTPEARARMSAQSKARWADPLFKAQLIEANKKSQTPSRLAKASVVMKSKWADLAYVDNVMKGRAAGKTLSKDERSAIGKANWEKPEFQEKMKVAVMATRTDEALAKRSETMKARWKEPEYLKKMKNRGKKK